MLRGTGLAPGDETVDELARFRALLDDPADGAGGPGVDPARRRRRRIRGAIIAGTIVLVLVATIGAYAGYTLNAPVGTAVVSTRMPVVTPPPAASVPMSEGATAVSVAGADAYLGPGAPGVWMASGGDDPHPMASITKLVTAMVVLDAHPLDGPDDPGPTLTFDAHDHALYDKYYVLGATIAAMPAGSSMSLHDAIETMLVVSACNYAEAVAEWAFGSQGAFLRAAERWLEANGFPRTTIVEPTGLDPGSTSPPTELLALGHRAMADPVLARIVGMPRLDVPSLDAMPNTNNLVGRDGITGIKTGTLEGSGSNLLFSATLPVTGLAAPLSIVGVVLGGSTHASVNEDVGALLNGIAEGFHRIPLGQAGDEVGTYTTRWGASARMVLGDGASLLTWSDTPVTVTTETSTLTTGTAGQQVGTATWTAGPESVSVPIVLEGDIPPPTEWWRLTHPFDLGG
jgi:serine-type D-Ala-D-Ala carboxypeptidase (penicillin-binding protein 5/6)